MDAVTHCSEDKYDFLKVYFDEESWNALSLYEKEKCAARKRNHEVLKSLGLNPKPPLFMQPKYKLKNSTSLKKCSQKEFDSDSSIDEPSEEDFEIKSALNKKEFDSDSSKDEPSEEEFEIKSALSKKERTQSSLELMNGTHASSSHDSQKTSDILLPETAKSDLNTDAFSSQNSGGKKRYPKRKAPKIRCTEEQISSEDDNLYAFSSQNSGGKKRYPKRKAPKIRYTEEEISSEDDNLYAFSSQNSGGKQRYPKRNAPKISYTEEEISSEDDYLWCEDCGKEFEGECPVHGRLIQVLNKKVPRGSDPNRARLTCPSFLSVGRSGIKGAGLGIWTEMALPKGFVFGPYEGKIVKKKKEAEKNGYAWQVRRRGRIIHYLDGSDTSVSTWLRFVNCAPCERRQNLIAFQYNGEIYYKTYKPVPAFAELLVWYGNQFAEDLDIDLNDDSDADCSQTGDCNENNILEKSSTEKGGSLKLLSLDKHTEKVSEYPTISLNFGNKSADGKSVLPRTDANNTKENVIPLKKGDAGLKFQGEKEKRKERTCLHCDFTTKKLSHLERHVMAVHEKLKPHSCPHCEYRSAQSCLLRRHVQSVHEGLKPYKCPHCEYSASRPSVLRRHVQSVHEGLKPCKCPHCEYSASRPSVLRRHVQSVHEGLKPHKCTHCEYRAVHTDSIRLHMRTVHMGLKPHKCTRCEYKAAQTSDLRRHTRAVHEGLKLYKCPHCEHKTAVSTSLRVHIRAVHERLKPHVCPHCEYRAARRDCLRRHVQSVHEGLKPHECPHCEYRSSRSADLQKLVNALHAAEKPH